MSRRAGNTDKEEKRKPEMVEKNQIIRAVTEALSSNGEGIVRHEGITFFVPYCLPGEKISFRVLKIKDKIGYGKA